MASSRLLTRPLSSTLKWCAVNATSMARRLSSTPSPDPSQTARPYDEIPKTKTTLGLNLDVIRNPTKMSSYLKEKSQQLGQIFRLVGLPGFPAMVVVVHPKDIEAVFRAGDTAKYPERVYIKEWRRARQEMNVHLSMFFASGEDWHQQRMPMAKFMLMPRKMAEFQGPFNEVALDYIKFLLRHRHEDNISSDIIASLDRWSLEAISVFVLGKRLGFLEDELAPDWKQYMDDVYAFFRSTNKLLFYGLPFHKIWRTKKWKELIRSQTGTLVYTGKIVDQKIKEIEEEDAERTEEIKAEQGPTDFVTYMIRSGKMSVKEIAVNAMDLVTPGVETTSLTLGGALYSLATNPDVQDRLREEVRSVLGQDEVVTAQHIQDMPYLRNTIKETLRLYPITPMNSRILEEDIVLSGYKIPAGTNIMMSTVASGYHPESFPEPEKFKPERWSRDNAEPPNAFASLPFGHGRRMCGGRRVAELEMHILLAHLMRKFRLEFREEEPIKFIDQLFLHPERPINLAFIDI